MRKFVLLTAVAIGYVLGARAGRERYEQIRRFAFRVKENPTVQSTARHAADAATAAAPVVGEKVVDGAAAAAHGATVAAHGVAAAAQKVMPGGGSDLPESGYPDGQ